MCVDVTNVGSFPGSSSGFKHSGLNYDGQYCMEARCGHHDVTSSTFYARTSEGIIFTRCLFKLGQVNMLQANQTGHAGQ